MISCQATASELVAAEEDDLGRPLTPEDVERIIDRLRDTGRYDEDALEQLRRDIAPLIPSNSSD